MDIDQGHLRAFREGRGNHTAWAELGARLGVAHELAQAGIANDHIETLDRGLQALEAVHQRAYGPHPSWTLRGPEIGALDDALWLVSVQLQHCSQGELEHARQRFQRRTEQALAGNGGARVRVLFTVPKTEAAGVQA